MQIASSSGFKYFVTDQVDAELRLYTNDDFQPDPGTPPDPHAVSNRLSWVLTYWDSPVPATLVKKKPASCDFILVVDADKGNIIDSIHQCPGTPSGAARSSSPI